MLSFRACLECGSDDHLFDPLVARQGFPVQVFLFLETKIVEAKRLAASSSKSMQKLHQMNLVPTPERAMQTLPAEDLT